MNKEFRILDFSELMRNRVRSIMLVCSAYDRFILEEDGRIEEQLTREYADLSLTSPPCFTRVSSADEALQAIESGVSYDLIITLFNVGSLSPFDFAKAVKRVTPKTPVVLLTSFSHEINRRLSVEDISGIDYVFAWQGNAELLIAIIKMVEDRENAQCDMLQNGVQGILLVEDSVRFYSAYLPDLYSMVIRQTDDFAHEALNARQQNLRKRSRPKVLFARNYNEAKEIYQKYRTNLLGVITDVSFKINNDDAQVKEMAGIELCKEILRQDPNMPVLMQSSDSLMAEQAQRLGVDFVDKKSKKLLDQLADFIKLRLAFGRFRFVDPQSGQTVAFAENLEELHGAVEKMPERVLTYYAKQHMFSKWLYARGLFSLARTIRSIPYDYFELPDQLRNYIVTEIEKYRRQIGRGVVAEFNPATYNRYITFARSGSGSLGGKARGLAFVSNLIEQFNLYDRWEGVSVSIPRTFVATTEHFDRFMDENLLRYVVKEAQMNDDEILSEFMGARLDETFITNLRAFVETINSPLAVRSSSLLEDSHYQPFAGIYKTYMVPFDANRERMLRLLLKAVKSVYASVYYASSRAYIEASGNVLAEEKMAIVIQQVCGTRVDDAYYPTLSGVARSLNFYPLSGESSEDGVCNIAMGLGKEVVEGGVVFRFSPTRAKHALQLTSPEIALRETQRYIYALDMSASSLKTSTDDGINLRRIDVQKLKLSPHIRFTASTWDMQNDRLTDGPMDQGRKVITFAPILKYDMMPLADIVQHLLNMGTDALHGPVEIEFAVNMDVPQGSAYQFRLLQIRPISSLNSSVSIDWTTVDKKNAIMYAVKALGNGVINDVEDIVYVRADNFDPSQTVAIAAEISALNGELGSDKRGYVLVGPGRWGSSDSWLGVPVKWADISWARLIAECGRGDFQVDPSQGTHFFQNLTSFGVGYVTLNPDLGDGVMAFGTLDAMPARYESHFVRHVRFDRPLRIVVDGCLSRAIVER